MRSHAHNGGSIGDLRRGLPAAKLPHAKEFGREGTVAEFRYRVCKGLMNAVLQRGGSAGLLKDDSGTLLKVIINLSCNVN